MNEFEPTLLLLDHLQHLLLTSQMSKETFDERFEDLMSRCCRTTEPNSTQCFSICIISVNVDRSRESFSVKQVKHTKRSK
jgi:hypothetical protein